MRNLIIKVKTFPRNLRTVNCPKHQKRSRQEKWLRVSILVKILNMTNISTELVKES